MKTTDLYEIVGSRKDENGGGDVFVYEARLNGEHDVFKGHFPETPVMPGVCMLQLLKDCIADATGKNRMFERIKSCKFVSVVSPEDNPLLTVSFTLTDNNLQATLSANDIPALKIKTTLTDA